MNWHIRSGLCSHPLQAALKKVCTIIVHHFLIHRSLFSAERVIVPDTLVEELADLRFAFANLLYSYENEIQSSPESQEKFIKFLPRLFRRDIEDHSFQSLFNMLIGEEVSLFNTHYLKRICSIFSEDVW